MNRPPTPIDTVWYMKDGLREYSFLIPELAQKYNALEANCMQEALTAEWLISIGAMPDPTESMIENDYYENMFDDWLVEDRDPDGKPEDYKV